MSEARTNVMSWLAEEFSSMLMAVFETMAGERPEIKVEPASDAAESSGDNALRWRQRFSNLEGAAWIAAAAPAWTAAGGYLLRAAGIEGNDAAVLQSTYFETIGQALASLAQEIGARLGAEVNCTGGVETAEPASGETSWVALRMHLGGETASLSFGIEPSLLDVLAASKEPVAIAPPPAPEAAPESSAAPTALALAARQNPKTFDLLLDVELPVSVSFGRAQVQLKDVLKLTTGSIVELNRSIQEPVEVIVNNCIIAHGEVVVVEGNFGVRIHQVISRQERLRAV